MISHKIGIALFALELGLPAPAHGAALNASSGVSAISGAMDASSKSSEQSTASSREPDNRYKPDKRDVVVTVAARDEAARWLASGGKAEMSPLLSSTVDAYVRMLVQRGEFPTWPSDMVAVRHLLLHSEGKLPPAPAPALQPADGQAPPSPGVTPPQPAGLVRELTQGRPVASVASAAQATSSQPLYDAQRLYVLRRYAEALAAGKREARSGVPASWLIVGLAACRLYNASAASEAYLAADLAARSQIQSACSQSGYTLVNESFTWLKKTE